jgi:ATP-dependent DNA helicase RecQ
MHINMNRAQSILKEVFGFETFWPLQEKVIAHILEKKDALVVMPTGGGKSLCYQIPAMIFDGLTIVVSPLISLMKDQVDQLREYGVPALFLNSALSMEEYRANVSQLRENRVKLLYLAPEALLAPRTLALLSALNVDCIAIDEAHCISEWGHDFRPEYRQLAAVRATFPDAACVALTATATPRVREDIRQSLNIDVKGQYIGSFNRPNLFLEVVPKTEPLDQVLTLLKQYPNESGIIYCATRRQTDDLHAVLHRKGYSVRPYHAGLSEKERTWRRSPSAWESTSPMSGLSSITICPGASTTTTRRSDGRDGTACPPIVSFFSAMGIFKRFSSSSDKKRNRNSGRPIFFSASSWDLLKRTSAAVFPC